MQVFCRIIYMDDERYYTEPVPPYIYSILSYHENMECIKQILKKDSVLNIECPIDKETTVADIQNIICSRMNKYVGNLCSSCPCICTKSQQDFIRIENLLIKIEYLLNKFDIKDIFYLYFVFSAFQGDVWREGQIRYYMQSHESGRHNQPHIHVNISGQYNSSINILTGETLAGEVPQKYRKEVENKIKNNREFLIFCWNNMTDGLKVDINYRFGNMKVDF